MFEAGDNLLCVKEYPIEKDHHLNEEGGLKIGKIYECVDVTKTGSFIIKGFWHKHPEMATCWPPIYKTYFSVTVPSDIDDWM